jgi:TRAP-type C4-dicarboxylate transport system permease small subunit
VTGEAGGIRETGVADTPVPPTDLGRTGRIVSTVAGAMIFFMTTIMKKIIAPATVDVIGRDFLNVPLFGAFEMTEILMGLVIFAGMPLTTAAREHITVNFLESSLSYRTRCVQAALGDVLCAGVAAVMAWRICARGLGLIEAHETTMMLGVGRGYIAIAMSVLMAAAALVFVYNAARAVRAASRAT